MMMKNQRSIINSVNYSNFLPSGFDQKELDVAAILLELHRFITQQPDLNFLLPFRWGVKRRRSADDVSSTHPSLLTQSPDPQRLEGIVEGPTFDKGGAAEEEAASPVTPLSFAPRSESDEKPIKRLKRKNLSVKKMKEELLEIIEKQSQAKNIMETELQNIKCYFEKLKAYNFSLKARKHELIGGIKSDHTTTNLEAIKSEHPTTNLEATNLEAIKSEHPTTNLESTNLEATKSEHNLEALKSLNPANNMITSIAVERQDNYQWQMPGLVHHHHHLQQPIMVNMVNMKSMMKQDNFESFPLGLSLFPTGTVGQRSISDLNVFSGDSHRFNTKHNTLLCVDKYRAFQARQIRKQIRRDKNSNFSSSGKLRLSLR